MTKPLSDADQRMCDAFATLVFGNPFLPERVEAERVIGDVCGHTIERVAAVWHRPLDLDTQHNRLTWISRVAAELAERVAACGPMKHERRAAMSAPGLYAAFYTAAPVLQQIVRNDAAGRDHDPALIRDAWRSFRQTYRRLLVVDGQSLLPIDGVDEGHLFAIAYQTFRTFHAIFHQLFGGNTAAATLRASVWQSCFTRDRLRHAAGAYATMQSLPTLVLGESGTGKEVVARCIAAGAYRRFDETSKTFAPRGGFEAVTLAAMPATLVESELFGHRRGSFTGAAADRPGRLERVGHAGIAFLDEIGDVEPAVQVKVLRVIQERTFTRIGDTTPRSFDGRIIAATHRDLPTLLASGAFRTDLYYRLAADVITTPPLRDLIGGDEAELSQLVALACRRLSPIDSDRLTSEVLAAITDGVGLDHTWPGNFRELEQCCRSVLVGGSYTPPATPRDDAAALADELRKATLSADEVTTRYCRLAVARHGTPTAAARVIGLDRRTVQSRLKS